MMPNQAKYPTYDELIAERTDARYQEAKRCAGSVLRMLRERDIGAMVFGSLVRGPHAGHGRFRFDSDVDFLITSLPENRLRYDVETDVETIMGAIPFDVVYWDEVRSPLMRKTMMEGAVDEAPLR
ncbi:MAG: hypothetical protein ACYDEV_15845 [Acidiferrobacter sp.]